METKIAPKKNRPKKIKNKSRQPRDESIKNPKKKKGGGNLYE